MRARGQPKFGSILPLVSCRNGATRSGHAESTCLSPRLAPSACCIAPRAFSGPAVRGPVTQIHPSPPAFSIASSPVPIYTTLENTGPLPYRPCRRKKHGNNGWSASTTSGATSAARMSGRTSRSFKDQASHLHFSHFHRRGPHLQPIAPRPSPPFQHSSFPLWSRGPWPRSPLQLLLFRSRGPWSRPLSACSASSAGQNFAPFAPSRGQPHFPISNFSISALPADFSISAFQRFSFSDFPSPTTLSRFATIASIAGKCGLNTPPSLENKTKIGHHFGCVNW
jgi:hypothetical protein